MPNTQYSASSNNSYSEHRQGKGRFLSVFFFFSFGLEHAEWWDGFWQVDFEMSVGNAGRNVPSDTADAEVSHYHLGKCWSYEWTRSPKESV